MVDRVCLAGQCQIILQHMHACQLIIDHTFFRHGLTYHTTMQDVVKKKQLINIYTMRSDKNFKQCVMTSSDITMTSQVTM